MKEATNVDKLTTNKVSFKKLVCPFDLDSIFSMQYSVSGLKSVLEFIIEHLDSSSVQFADLFDAAQK